MKRFLLLIVIILTAVFNPNLSKSGEVDSLLTLISKDPENINLLRQIGYRSLSQWKDSIAEQCALKLLNISSEKDPHGEAETYGMNILGQVNIMRGNGKEGYKYLAKARRLAELRNDSASLASIFNGLAIYNFSEIGDMPGAISYYNKGMAAAKAIGNDDLYYKLINNLANAYLELKDKTGLKYAIECYEYAETTNNHKLLFISALCQADYYHRFSDDTRALLYINKAEDQLPYLENENLAELYNLKAKIFSQINHKEKAELNFTLAKEESRNLLERFLPVLNSQAEHEIKFGNYNKAEILLDSLLLLSSDNLNNHARIPAVLNYSILKEKQGNINEALRLLKYYNELKDSAINYTTSQMMVDAQERYKFEELSSKLATQKVEIAHHQRNFYVVLAIALIFLILISFGIFWHRKQKSIHHSILKQIKQAQKTEETLLHKIDRLENKKSQAESETVNQTLQKIMEDIEILMKEAKIYRDSNLTRDSLAETIGSNATYISKAILDNLNLTFNQYINSYRLKEAQQILLDTDNETPIKNIGTLVGFNSSTSFYNNFKEATGMTPAAFRAAAKT